MVTKMDQMVVYRVEHRTSGIGMYQFGWEIHSMMSDSTQHPGPPSDTRLMEQIKLSDLSVREGCSFNRECRFGFASKKQMRNWVSDDEWKKVLALKGLVVAKYKVPKANVAIGSTQVVFHPANAMRLSTMCPTKI